MRRFTAMRMYERNTKYAIRVRKRYFSSSMLLLLLSICFTLNIFYFRIQSVCVCKTGIYFAYVFAFNSIVSREMYIIMYMIALFLLLLAVLLPLLLVLPPSAIQQRFIHTKQTNLFTERVDV